MVKFKEILMTIYKNKIGFKYPNKVDVRSREKKKTVKIKRFYVGKFIILKAYARKNKNVNSIISSSMLRN